MDEGNYISNIHGKFQDHTSRIFFNILISNIKRWQPPRVFDSLPCPYPQVGVPSIFFIKMIAKDVPKITYMAWVTFFFIVCQGITCWEGGNHLCLIGRQGFPLRSLSILFTILPVAVSAPACRTLSFSGGLA